MFVFYTDYISIAVLQLNDVNTTISKGEIPGVKYAIGSNVVSISLFKKPHKLTEYPAGKPAFNITFPFKVKMF